MTTRWDRYPDTSVPGDRQDTFGVRDVVARYDVGAPMLVPEYESLSFEAIHAPVLDLLPDSAGCILDVGAGTGRDAAWFATNGHNVVAVEPSARFRTAGKERHSSPDIRWMDDTLPALEKVLRSKLTFDLIWVSSVWMHVPRSVRARAFRKLVSVMSPGASMMFSLCQGPPPLDRPMEPATATEVEELARRHGLQTVRSTRIPDAAGRTEVSWDDHLTALRWLEPEHDTGIVREVGQNLRRSGSALLCVWTGRRLRDEFEVDHCFPFAAWPCNDLWNLLPSSATVNRSKGDRLPTPEALEQARPRMLEWWDRAYLRDALLAARFKDEVRSALPTTATDSDRVTPESLFEGIMIRQIVLKRDQQLAEWVPGR